MAPPTQELGFPAEQWEPTRHDGRGGDIGGRERRETRFYRDGCGECSPSSRVQNPRNYHAIDPWRWWWWWQWPDSEQADLVALPKRKVPQTGGGGGMDVGRDRAAVRNHTRSQRFWMQQPPRRQPILSSLRWASSHPRLDTPSLFAARMLLPIYPRRVSKHLLPWTISSIFRPLAFHFTPVWNLFCGKFWRDCLRLSREGGGWDV